ncbi:MAG: DUF4170 domain-containing protein, partial [Dehalococcoidia bacterium]
YYVVGGEYSDTTFRRLEKPAALSGPFESYEEAYDAWRARSMATIDQAYARFQIVQTVDSAPVPGMPDERRAPRA